MGLVVSAATGRGWTTGSGMEGPPAPAELESPNQQVSTFPWSLFTKSPRRRMRVAFTCNVCGQRTTRAINPHAYTDGTVFVQVFTSLQPQISIPFYCLFMFSLIYLQYFFRLLPFWLVV
jgi:DNL zinc finger